MSTPIDLWVVPPSTMISAQYQVFPRTTNNCPYSIRIGIFGFHSTGSLTVGLFRDNATSSSTIINNFILPSTSGSGVPVGSGQFESRITQSTSPEYPVGMSIPMRYICAPRQHIHTAPQLISGSFPPSSTSSVLVSLLATPALSQVPVIISSTNTNVVSVNPDYSELTFTSTTWLIPQQVMITFHGYGEAELHLESFNNTVTSMWVYNCTFSLFRFCVARN